MVTAITAITEITAITAITSALGGHGSPPEAAGQAAWWGILAAKLAEGLVGILAGILALAVVRAGTWRGSSTPRQQA